MSLTKKQERLMRKSKKGEYSMKKKKYNDYEAGVKYANQMIRDSNASEISKLHDEADKKMYRNMHKMRTSKEWFIRQGSKQLYWFNRGKATAYGYFHHNGKLLKKRRKEG